MTHSVAPGWSYGPRSYHLPRIESESGHWHNIFRNWRDASSSNMNRNAMYRTFRAQDHYRPLQLLLDHRYDLSQFPQPAFETCLVDPKVAASELGPRVHRQCAAAFGLLDIADHDRVRKSQ